MAYPNPVHARRAAPVFAELGFDCSQVVAHARALVAGSQVGHRLGSDTTFADIANIHVQGFSSDALALIRQLAKQSNLSIMDLAQKNLGMENKLPASLKTGRMTGEQEAIISKDITSLTSADLDFLSSINTNGTVQNSPRTIPLKSLAITVAIFNLVENRFERFPRLPEQKPYEQELVTKKPKQKPGTNLSVDDLCVRFSKLLEGDRPERKVAADKFLRRYEKK